MVASETAISIEITSVKGSAPRDVGALMWVGHSWVKGSIGGGNMEAQAVKQARKMLQEQEREANEVFTLGPETGQCCGGVVMLAFRQAVYEAPKSQTLAIFGAGHVGANLKRLAEAIGLNVLLYDERSYVEIENPETYLPIAIPERAIEQLPHDACVVILTHDHGLDFLLAEAALKREFPFVGMIGSRSKATRFKQNHHDLNFDKFHSPIAKSGHDKRPEVIALAILNAVLQES